VAKVGLIAPVLSDPQCKEVSYQNRGTDIGKAEILIRRRILKAYIYPVFYMV
jgi:hypothetical protein